MVSKGVYPTPSSAASSSNSSATSSSAGGYTIMEPDPPLSIKEVDAMKEYASSLEDLTMNSKPLINMLTMLAEENREQARAIVLAIEHHLRKVPADVKLPVLYLIDSIYKNVGSPYNTLFNQNIVQMFCSVFEKGDEKTRMQLFKLRTTWNQMLPPPKLYALDVHVSNFDPAWPVQQLSTIHVNPKFLHTQGGTATTTAAGSTVTPTPTTTTTASPNPATTQTTTTDAPPPAAKPDAEQAAILRENLRKKQKKLLELRQKKLELELLQTKEKLREQELLQQQQANDKTKQRRSSKHSGTLSSSGTSSSSLSSTGTSSSGTSSSGGTLISSKTSSINAAELEKQRTRLSQQLKQELKAIKTSVTQSSASIASLVTAKVTPTTVETSTVPTPPTTTSAVTKPQPAGMPATGTPAVMRIAPVSSQLISAAVKRGATRDPRLMRAAQAESAVKPPPPAVVTSSKTTSSVVTSSKTSNVTTSSKMTTSSVVTSPPTKPSVVTSSPLKNVASVTSSKSGSKSPSKSVGAVTSSSSVTSSSKQSCESGDEIPAAKKSRTSGGSGGGTTADKSSSSRSKSSSRSSESAGGKHHHHHHSHHHEKHQKPEVAAPAAKMIDTVTEKDSLDLVKKEEPRPRSPAPPAVDQSQELATHPAAPRSGQLLVAPPPGLGKRLSEERDVPPPPKKTKVMSTKPVDRFDELFGDSSEAIPQTPPPPSITEAELKSTPELTSADSQVAPSAPLAADDGTNRNSGRWSKYKAHRQTSVTSEPYPKSNSKKEANKDTDRLGRPLLYKHGGSAKDRRNSLRAGIGGAVLEHLAEQDDCGGGEEEDSEGSRSPPAEEGAGCSYILQQAEEQFKNGTLSSTQYNQILKEMISINELKKLDEARRKEERESRRSRRKYRHHQKISQSEESTAQPDQPITEQNKLPVAAGENGDFENSVEDEVRSLFSFDLHDSDSETISDYEEDWQDWQDLIESLNGDNRTENDMDISADEDSESIKGPEEERRGDKVDVKEETKPVYEPLQPPPMPPAFVSRRSSEEEEGERTKVEQEKEVRENEEEDVEMKKELMPTKQDVDNRLGFAGIGLAALSPPQDGAGNFPPVINSTKDIDLRIGLPQRPLVGARPLPEVGPESAVPAAVARSKKGPPLPPWGAGAPPGAPWMMQAPLPCWAGPMPPAIPPGLAPIRPPPMPPQVMFEPETNTRLIRPLPRPIPPPQQLLAGGAAPPAGPVDLPSADLSVLEAIADDTMKSIEIDGMPRDIRYYGTTAVVFLAWDDPREILFQATGPRKLVIDDRQTVVLDFNAPFKDVVIGGEVYPVRLGGPTRELYVGSQFYQVLFGGPPVSVALGANDRLHKLQLDGPPPQVRIGVPRRDLCLGRITLFVDARHQYTIYLDPKPQRFDLDGVPHIIRFVEALETTVINGVPFKFEFGGLPRPIQSRGKKHYIRLTSLPQGVVPGYVSIFGMEGGRRGAAVPPGGRPLPQRAGGVPPHLLGPEHANSQGSESNISPTNGNSPREDFLQDDHSMPMMDSEAALMEPPNQFRKHISPAKANPLDVLSTLLAPAATAPVSGFSYSLEKESTSSSYQPALTTDPNASKPKAPNPSGGSNLLGDLNIQELFEKLVATGIVPTNQNAAAGGGGTAAANQSTAAGGGGGAATNQEKAVPEGDQSDNSMDCSHIDTSPSTDKMEFVDFAKPQTLRVRQPAMISQLYSGIQCSSCGVRFAPAQTIKYSQHLDWHFRQNRRERDASRLQVMSRTWYYDLSDWTQFEEIEDIEERALSWFDTHTVGGEDGEKGGGDGEEGGEDLADVPSAACESGAVDVKCQLCHDRFDIFYNEEKEEWHVRRAVKQETGYYHPLCWDDHLASLKTPPPELEEVEKQEPIDSITIDEDDSEEGVKKEGEEGVKKEEEEEDDDDVIIQEPEHKMEIIELLKDDDDEEEEEERSRMREEGDESSSKLSSDKKDSEDGDSMKPTDFHSILRNIKKEKEEVVGGEGEQEVIDLDATARRGEGDGELEGEGEGEGEDELLMNRPPPVVDTTQVKVACSIDGNVELDDSGAANMLAAPSKIKINISKAIVAPPVVAPSPPRAPSPPQHPPVVVVPPIVEELQPPPPGEEPVSLKPLKPRLIGHKLEDLPPVTKGNELSGLCSIM